MVPNRSRSLTKEVRNAYRRHSAALDRGGIRRLEVAARSGDPSRTHVAELLRSCAVPDWYLIGWCPVLGWYPGRPAVRPHGGHPRHRHCGNPSAVCAPSVSSSAGDTMRTASGRGTRTSEYRQANVEMSPPGLEDGVQGCPWLRLERGPTPNPGAPLAVRRSPGPRRTEPRPRRDHPEPVAPRPSGGRLPSLPDRADPHTAQPGQLRASRHPERQPPADPVHHLVHARPEPGRSGHHPRDGFIGRDEPGARVARAGWRPSTRRTPGRFPC